MDDYHNIRRMPGRRVTPDTVLAETLGKAKRIKAVAVVIQWNDGSFDTDWSNMRITSLATMAHMLEVEVHRLLRGETEVLPPDPALGHQEPPA